MPSIDVQAGLLVLVDEDGNSRPLTVAERDALSIQGLTSADLPADRPDMEV